MKVIMHNSVTLDSSMKELSLDISTHYEIVGKYKPDAYMFGSKTALNTLQTETSEEKSDFNKPKKDKPYWVIVDSKGQLEFHLHNFRRSSYAGNLIILLSETTPKSYIQYLQARKYEYLICGKDHVNYKKALKLLEKNYEIKTTLLDSGGKLNSYLFKNNLIDEISILINPSIAGKEGINLFRELSQPINLDLIKNEKIKEKLVWLVYKVLK